METKLTDIKTPLTISEDTAKLVHLFDVCSAMFDTATEIFEKYYGDNFTSFKECKNLLAALQVMDDAISVLIGFSAQMHYKGLIGDAKDNYTEI